MKSKHNFLLLLSGLLILSLTSCGSESSADMSNSSSASPSNSSITPDSSNSASPSSDSTPNPPESVVEFGKIVALDDQEFYVNPSEVRAGTQNELDRWTDLIKSGNITNIAVSDMNDSESALSTENARSIVKILIDANLKLHDELGNPMTGGSTKVLAYDSSGALLFHSIYDGGEWFWVIFADEDVAYIFNPVGCSLDSISDYIP